MTEAPKNIIVVDADPVQRQALADLLLSDGHAVLLASGAEEALLKLENGQVDLVLAEEEMPGVTGRELLWECVRRWQGLPFIMLTGSGTVSRAVAAIKAGKRMADALQEAGLFTPLALNMVRLGEETGRLDEMLLEVARVHDDEVQSGVKRSLQLIEPLLIIVMGGMIAMIIVSILLGILSVNDLAG